MEFLSLITSTRTTTQVRSYAIHGATTGFIPAKIIELLVRKLLRFFKLLAISALEPEVCQPFDDRGFNVSCIHTCLVKEYSSV